MARVPYVRREELPETDRHIYDEIARPRGVSVVGNAFSALLNAPEAAGRVGAVGAYLRYQSELPAVVRETTILTVARELRCQYEWTHHEPVARQVGVRDECIAAIREGTAPDGLLPDERMVVQYAQELLRRHEVAPDTFEAAHAKLGRKGVVELTLVVGYYTLLALSFSALQVEVE